LDTIDSQSDSKKQKAHDNSLSESNLTITERQGNVSAKYLHFE